MAHGLIVGTPRLYHPTALHSSFPESDRAAPKRRVMEVSKDRSRKARGRASDVASGLCRSEGHITS